MQKTLPPCLSRGLTLLLGAAALAALPPGSYGQFPDSHHEVPQPPATAAPVAAPLRDHLFMILMDGGFLTNSSTSAAAQNGANFLKAIVPDLGIFAVENKPETSPAPAYYRTNNIPVLTQANGYGYMNFMTENAAFEIDWDGRVMSSTTIDPVMVPLAGSPHAIAFPSLANNYIYSQMMTSSIKSGYGGFGFQDMTWLYDSYGARQMYHPDTIAAFKADLNGTDAGLKIQVGSGAVTTIKFSDYISYYLGGMPAPADLGFTTWNDFPYNKVQWNAHSDLQRAQHDILCDYLRRYEWLHFADAMGAKAKASNGVFQCETNEEWFPNGVDTLFASSLKNVGMVTEEFMQTPENLDGAYYRYNYLNSRKGTGTQMGIVMEEGGGGSAPTYYQPEIAYLSAYELSTCTKANHFEADAWPNMPYTFDYEVMDPHFRTTLQTLSSFAVGYKHALADNLQRQATDFVSITNRQTNRTWGVYWRPWDWWLSGADMPSPDSVLQKDGYLFEGRSEEGLNTMALPQQVVFYSPPNASLKGWNYLKGLLNNGNVKRVVSTAQYLQGIVTPNLSLVGFSTQDAAINFPAGTGAAPTGLLSGSTEIPITAASYTVAGKFYTAQAGTGFVTAAALGTTPVAVRKTYTGGDFIVLLFDPTIAANHSLAVALYEGLLSRKSIYPRWQSLAGGAIVRAYKSATNTMLAYGVQRDEFRGDATAIDGQYAYTAPGTTTQFKVKVGTTYPTYNYLALPSGVSGSVAIDSSGFVALGLKNTAHEVFYLLPAAVDQAPLTALAGRKAELQNVISLGGRIKTTPDTNVSITRTTGGVTIAPAQATMSSTDALQGLQAAVTNAWTGAAIPGMVHGSAGMLTDANPANSGQVEDSPLVTDQAESPLNYTWDLGGTAADAYSRQLDSMTLWIAGGDVSRAGFRGSVETSLDGIHFTALLQQEYNANNFDTTGSTVNGYFKVAFKFMPGTVNNFRYLRLFSDNVQYYGERQTRYVEVDAQISRVRVANLAPGIMATRNSVVGTPDAQVGMSANDALQGLVATVTTTAGAAVTTFDEGTPARLTDATSATAPVDNFRPNDWTPVNFTWDLGTAIPAANRQLNSFTIWGQGGDFYRLGFRGMLSTSADGVTYTPLLPSEYDANCFETDTSTNTAGVYKLRFDFLPGMVTNFRFLRLLADNGGGGVRQPRFREIDAEVSKVAVTAPAAGVNIIRTAGGNAVKDGGMEMWSTDALFCKDPVITRVDNGAVYDWTTDGYGAIGALTDAVVPALPSFYLLPSDWTPVDLTWDLGGLAGDAAVRQLNALSAWTSGTDGSRTGFHGQVFTSTDGVNFTPVNGTDFNANNFDLWDGVSHDAAGYYNVSYKFAPGTVTNFRYLRLRSFNGAMTEQRQPRYDEIDAVLGPAN